MIKLGNIIAASLICAVLAGCGANPEDMASGGRIKFCGFYPGMQLEEAQNNAKGLGLNAKEWDFTIVPSTKQVCELTFTLPAIRKMTKGGDSFEELAQAVANRVGTMEPRYDDNYNLVGYEYRNIDGQTAFISERTILSEKYACTSGLTLSDTELFSIAAQEKMEEARKEAAEKAEAERKAEAEKAEAVRKAIEEQAKVAVAKLCEDMVPIPSKDYAICKYEVTQALWFAVMGTNPSEFKGADLPVDHVSWYDCQYFLEKLNDLPEVKTAGVVYRLPTSDEWVYACLSGAKGGYCKLADGSEINAQSLDEVAWHTTWNEQKREWGKGGAHPVGQKKPNAFGLYDMIGNVSEWTSETNGQEDFINGPKTASEDGEAKNCGGSWDSVNGGKCSASVQLSRCNSRTATIGLRLAHQRKAEDVEAEQVAAAEALADRAKNEIAKLASNMVVIPGKDYALCKYEVSQALWEAVMGDNPSQCKGQERPVENVSVDDCKQFIDKINSIPEIKTGCHYRFPTVDEWFYAFRAGQDKKSAPHGNFDDSANITKDNVLDAAWLKENSRQTNPIGQKRPNAFGIFDMLGNVFELTVPKLYYKTGKNADDDDVFYICGYSCNIASRDFLSNDNPSSWYDSINKYRHGSAMTLTGLRLARDLISETEKQEAIRRAKEEAVAKLSKDMVTIPGKDYDICKYEVTQALWEVVTGCNPSKIKGVNLPVEQVSWDDCQAFLEKLNALPEVKSSGQKYRLPTYEEWQYARCAGAVSGLCKLEDGSEPSFDTIEEVAWIWKNMEGTIHPVGQKKPNAFGLYDMIGNVSEWTANKNIAEGDGRRYGWGLRLAR